MSSRKGGAGVSVCYLKNGVGDHNVVDTVRVVHGGVHRDFQPNEYQGSKAEN